MEFYQRYPDYGIGGDCGLECPLFLAGECQIEEEVRELYEGEIERKEKAVSTNGECHDEGISGNCGLECSLFLRGGCPDEDEIRETCEEQTERKEGEPMLFSVTITAWETVGDEQKEVIAFDEKLIAGSKEAAKIKALTLLARDTNKTELCDNIQLVCIDQITAD